MRAALTPKLLALHIFALICISFAAVLGWWQLSVWQEARSDRAAELASSPAVPLDDVLTPTSAFDREAIGQPIEASGSWIEGSEAFVADRRLKETVGYWLVTFLLVDDAALPVVRGFTTSPELPRDWSETAGGVQLQGWLQPGEPALGDDPNPEDNVFPALRLADLVTRSDLDLYSGYVIQRDDVPAGLAAVTPDQLPKPDTFTSVRNLLYGIEWWIFGAFAAFLWWRWTKDEVDRVKSLSPTPGGPTEAAPVG